MIQLITFASKEYTISAKKLVESAWKFGCDCTGAIHDPQYLKDSGFYDLNKEIFDQPRGAGYWLWKPYIIYRRLLEMQLGEILFYSDAGVELSADIHHVTDCMGDNDIFLFSNGWNHADWCKADIMARINNTISNVQHTMSGSYFSLSENMLEKKQVQASNMFFRVSEKSRRFVKEWLCYAQLPGLIDDSPSIIPNAPTFQENRHDQAIIGSLAIRDNIPLRWFPSSTGYHIPRGDDQYPEIFLHHRKRNEDWQ